MTAFCEGNSKLSFSGLVLPLDTMRDNLSRHVSQTIRRIGSAKSLEAAQSFESLRAKNTAEIPTRALNTGDVFYMNTVVPQPVIHLAVSSRSSTASDVFQFSL